MTHLPSLKRLCLDCIIEHNDDISVLAISAMDTDVQDTILNALLRRGKLKNHHVGLLFGGRRTKLSIPMCALFDVSSMMTVVGRMDVSALSEIDLSGLWVSSLDWLWNGVSKLVLRDCGSSLTDTVVLSMLQGGKVQSLTELYLTNSLVTDAVMVMALGTQKRLTRLDVSGSRVTWTDLSAAFRLVSTFSYTASDGCEVFTVFPASNVLEVLGCSRLRFTDESVNYISRGFPNLRTLDISQNPLLTDLSLALVGSRLKKLRYLNVMHNVTLTDEGIRHLVCGSREISGSLKTLVLNQALCTQQTLLYIMSSLGSLERLDLWNLHTSAASVFLLGRHLSCLRELCLSNVCQGTLTQACMEELGTQLTQLTTLQLSDVPLVTSVECFATTSLTRLELKRMPLLLSVADCLSRNRSLTWLNFEECPSVNAAHVAEHAPLSLQMLGLGSMKGLNDAVIEDMVSSRCTALQRLQLDKSNVSASTVRRLLALLGEQLTHLSLCWIETLEGSLGFTRSARALRHVELWGDVALDDTLVHDLMGLASTLETLSIPRMRLVSPAALARLAQQCTLLSSLSISYTTVNDEVLAIICRSLLRLRVLNISGCESLTSSCLVDGLAHAKSLRSLYMSYCAELLSAEILHVVSACPVLLLIKISYPELEERVSLVRDAILQLNPFLTVMT